MKTAKLVFLLIFIPACASNTQQLDKKLANETQIETRRDLQIEADYLIQTSNVLSEAQKTSLIGLRRSTKSRLDDLQEESIKLRALLMRDVLSAKYNRKEVEKIKARMKVNEDKKLSTIFATVDEANRIIGRGKFDPQDPVFQDFFIFDTVRTGH